MADHVREQILDAIVSALGGAASLSTVTITKDRYYPEAPADLPAIDVQQGPDELLDESPYPFDDHQFDVRIVVYAQANDDPIEDANNWEKEAHAVLRANRQLGLADNVHDSGWAGTGEPERSETSNKKTVRLEVTWRVFYRTDVDDPST